MKDYDYICMPENGKITPFAIVANIIEETENNVTIERAMDFGNFKIAPATMSKKTFAEFYRKNIDFVPVFVETKQGKTYSVNAPVPIHLKNRGEEVEIVRKWVKENLLNVEYWRFADYVL